MTRIISRNKNTGEIIKGDWMELEKPELERHVELLNKTFTDYENTIEGIMDGEEMMTKELV